MSTSMGKRGKSAPKPGLARKLTPKEREDERQRLGKAAEDARARMEVESLRVRNLILTQAPVALLGYLWSQLHMSVLSEVRQKGEDEYRPNKDLIQKFQLALEYVHAVWCATANLPDAKIPLDEPKVAQLLEALEDLRAVTFHYCMASSAANIEGEGSRQSAETEFHAKTTWALIRGHRYQVLEEEFFQFILRPHDEALLKAYGMGSAAIAKGIQSIADSVRTGFGDAAQKMFDGMEQTYASMKGSDADLAIAVAKMKEGDPNFATDMSAAMLDMLYGGICNISRHSNFSAPLLEDLSYVPGGNVEFFAEGEFKGTPMRTLPALIRPGVKLGKDYYITDGQFVRDSAYRTIQRGVVARLPEYREEWNQRQKVVTENSYATIFAKQFADAKKFADVHFKDPKTGEWSETDLVMILADVLLVVEAKAGVQAMHSPATNFKSHERVIRSLIVSAYEQCKRFLEYVMSAPEVPIFNLIDGDYVEVAKIRQKDFRLILPIGLTVEAFTPFSAMCKELSEIQLILGKHAFVSMSVDDLFVLNRFLPTTGELLHYLEVRQAVGGIKRAMIFDEIEHLGAYIQNNRFDVTINEQLKEADMVTWDSFGDVVDRYFEGLTWETQPPPRQDCPEELKRTLAALDKYRPPGWLPVDAFIRNLGGAGRKDLAQFMTKIKSTLTRFPARRFLYGTEEPLQVWVCRVGGEPSSSVIHYHGQVGSIISNQVAVRVLILSYSPELKIAGVQCATVGPPSIIQVNYPEVVAEAEKQKGRLMPLKGRDRKKQRKRR